MPLSQNPIVEWPAELYHFLQDIRIADGPDGKRFGHIDIDVDRETLLLLNEFEARVRHRLVRFRMEDSAEECLVGEMNPLVGLGAAIAPAQHISKVRISFHNVKDDSCIDPTPPDVAAHDSRSPLWNSDQIVELARDD